MKRRFTIEMQRKRLYYENALKGLTIEMYKKGFTRGMQCKAFYYRNAKEKTFL